MKKLRARLMSITVVYPLVLTLVGMVLPNSMGVAAISKNEQDEIIGKQLRSAGNR
jgi:hypothetical protein